MPTSLWRSALFVVALLSAAGFVPVGWSQGWPAAGGLAVLLFLALSVACAGHYKFGGIAYTLLILAVVCLAFFYPAPLQRYGGFEFKRLIIPLLQFIMFCVGSHMSLRDFEGVLRMPRAVMVGLISHFTIMPLLGLSLAHGFGFPPEIAAGVILIGCVPAGLASNVMCFIAKANLALSITLTACSAALAPLLTPLLMKYLAGQFVPVSFADMMAHIVAIVAYPIMAGLMFNAIAYGLMHGRNILIQGTAFALLVALAEPLLGWGRQVGTANLALRIAMIAGWVLAVPVAAGLFVRHVIRPGKAALDRVMGYGSMAGICFILAVIIANGRESLLTIGLWLLLACLLHNLGGYLVGYWFGRLAKLDDRSCRTVALEVGLQNGGLATGIALEMGKVATMGLAPAIFGALQNVTGSILATWWRRVSVTDETAHER